jgi:hypothetical protein
LAVVAPALVEAVELIVEDYSRGVMRGKISITHDRKTTREGGLFVHEVEVDAYLT